MQRLWRKPCGIIAGFLVLMSSTGWARGAEEAYPIRGLTPREKIGGLVSIPGNPLPPLPEDSVRDAITGYELILTGWRILGETPSLARGIGYLATLYAAVGEASKAERLFDEAQRILEKNGATGRDLGWVYNNRGLTRLDQRRYAEAVQSFRAGAAALEPDRQELEPRAIVLQNLASVYHILGDVENSEEAYLNALEILRRLRKERDRTYQATRGNLATLYETIGDPVAAREILEELVDQGGMSSSLRFATLNNLGSALRTMKDFRSAAERFEEALTLTAEGSPERALVLSNLAAAYGDAGDFEKATAAGERALRLAEDLSGKGSSSSGAVEGTLGTVALARGDLPRAESLLTRARAALSKESGDQEALAGVTQVLAVVAQRQGRRERAFELSRQALDLKKKNLGRILAFGSEAQRLAYQSNADPYDQIANLGDGALLAEAVLATKGAVLESLLAERALVRKSRSPVDRERLDRIHALKVELMEKIGRGETHLEAIERDLKQEETALAKSLGRQASAERPGADLARVQAALESDQVLIEIVRFQLYEAGGKLAPWYGGIVIPRQGRPAWVPLGRAEGLEESIDSLLDRLDIGSRGAEPVSPLGDVTRTLHELDGQLWKPLVKVFPPGTRKVLLSPDGALSFVPWATLLDENQKFLVESWQLAQVGSGRDLLRSASRPSEKTLLALGDGKEDLPSARQEAESIARRAEAQGWRSTVLLGEQASEAALFQRPHPRILHLATHGGALKGEWAQAIGGRLGKRPMYRGFLWLGGAGRTLEAWKRGTVLPASDDGILTAEEAGGLDLGGTWLTVLSACQTGAGDARIGEGILGLRRGFALAGTENLLFTLWSVDDEPTGQFMESFYERLFRTRDLDRSFQEAQVAELLRWKQSRDIPGAVFRAGAFVLTR